jgi:two-component system, chemotaxis family, sensor histidine kinase and response regulator PixL
MAELDPRDEAYQCFVQEAVEHLQGLELGLLNLQHDHSTQQINTLMRHAHSLKGGASLFGLTASQDIAHNLENAFKALYSQTVTIDADLEDLLLQAYDCLREPLMDQIERHFYAPSLAVARAQPIFAKLEALLGHSLSGDGVGLPEPDLTSVLYGLESEFPDMVLAEAEAEAQSSLQQVLTGLEAEFPGLLVAESPPQPAPDTEQRQLLAQILEAEVSGFAELQQANLGDRRQQILLVETQKFLEIGEHFGVPGLTQIAQIALNELQSPDSSSTDLDKVSHLLLADLRRTQLQLASGQPDESMGPAALWALVSTHRSNTALVDPTDVPTLITTDETGELAPPSTPPRIPQRVTPVLEDITEIQDKRKQVAPRPIAATPASDNSPVNSAPVPATEAQTTLTAPTTVRVDVNRLDALNNLTGELVTLDNGLLLQQQQYKTLSERLKRWQSEFRQFSRRMSDDAVLTISPELLTQLQALKPESSLALFDDTEGDGVGFARDIIQQVTDQVLESVMQVLGNESFKLEEILQDFSATNKLHKSILTKQEQALKQVQTNLLQARMVPLQDVLSRFPRMVRDLSARFDKQVVLNLPAQPVMVDKMLLERLYDPLVHLIRNAFDHGIEPPEMRERHGKSPQGQISIEAHHRGNSTWIEIKDDGQGIKLSKIRAKLLQLQLCTPDQVNALSPEQLYEYLFTSGFTTTQVTTELSGRGVGLDAVRLQVEAMQGEISVRSELGVGTTFTLRFPYNLSVTQLLVFTVNGGGMAIPVKDLVTVTTVKTAQLEQQDSQWFYRHAGKQLPVITNLQRPTHARVERQLFSPNMGVPAKEEVTLLIVADRAEEAAILIDQTLMQQDLVVKAFGGLVKTPNYLTGCTILGDGRLITVLEGSALIAAWHAWQQGPAEIAPAMAALEATTGRLIAPRPALATASAAASSSVQEGNGTAADANDPDRVVAPPTILVVDDSMTIRQNLSVFLRRSGYQVLQASDGVEGLERLQQTAVIHAVISDVDMPNMNGLEFLRNCRQEFSPQRLPIIMLTSRNTENYRQLAKRLGANGYLGKPYLEAELLRTLRECLAASSIAFAPA